MSSQALRLVQARARTIANCTSFAALFLSAPGAIAQTTSDSQDLAPVVIEQTKSAPKPKPKPQKTVKSTTPSSAKSSASTSTQSKPTNQSTQSYPQSAASEPALAQQDQATVPQSVGSTGLAVPANTATVTRQSIAPDIPATSDTVKILTRVPGVSAYQAGGLSSLPVLNGLADDRVKVVVGGVEVTSACANHMNPPLSYVPPSSIGSVEVTSGVTSVSKGGDSLGGTVLVERPDATFADIGEGVQAWGSVSSFYRSNGDGFGGSVIAAAATSNFSLRYDGSFVQSGDYDRGDGGDIVRSTDYKAWNHGVTLTARSEDDVLTIHGGLQRIPYQGFPNQRMDMGDPTGDILGNEAFEIDARYKRRLDFGLLEANAFYNHVKHYMNFLDDKGGSTPTTGMPMFTNSVEYGYGIKLEMPVSPTGVVRVGNELHMQDYDEWWNATCTDSMGGMGMGGMGGMSGMGCMMGPQTFWNINGGSRDRLGTFVEWENRWSRAWSTLIGARNDVVWMDTGDVQPYNPMPSMMNPDAQAALDFNAQDHSKTDVNFDATAMARFQPDAASTFELAYGRKTRSPNLYERYAWARGNMAMNMVGWFGDVNGYTGNLNLKPEIANTVSFTAGWHDPVRRAWAFKVTPYYTYVQDFIDVDTIGTVISGTSMFAKLQFANHDAQLAGVNVSGEMQLWNDHDFGAFALAGTLGYVYGERTDGGALYHMMPINARLTLMHQLGNWSNAVEFQLVGDKDRVDERRYEPTTPSYALVNMRTSYEWENVRLDLGVVNLFDKLYYDPLGGRDFADWKVEGGTIGPVPGMGRSFNAGLTVKF